MHVEYKWTSRMTTNCRKVNTIAFTDEQTEHDFKRKAKNHQ